MQIIVEAQGLAQDPEASDSGYLPLYQTTRPFPASLAATLSLRSLGRRARCDDNGRADHWRHPAAYRAQRAPQDRGARPGRPTLATSRRRRAPRSERDGRSQRLRPTSARSSRPICPRIGSAPASSSPIRRSTRQCSSPSAPLATLTNGRPTSRHVSPACSLLNNASRPAPTPLFRSAPAHVIGRFGHCELPTFPLSLPHLIHYLMVHTRSQPQVSQWLAPRSRSGYHNHLVLMRRPAAAWAKSPSSTNGHSHGEFVGSPPPQANAPLSLAIRLPSRRRHTVPRSSPGMRFASAPRLSPQPRNRALISSSRDAPHIPACCAWRDYSPPSPTPTFIDRLRHRPESSYQSYPPCTAPSLAVHFLLPCRPDRRIPPSASFFVELRSTHLHRNARRAPARASPRPRLPAGPQTLFRRLALPPPSRSLSPPAPRLPAVRDSCRSGGLTRGARARPVRAGPRRTAAPARPGGWPRRGGGS